VNGTTVWLIRHAESTWNARGLWQGHGDPPLSPRGRAQAQQLAARLAAGAAPPERVIASDLARARETAALLAAALGVEIERDARLRELDVGAWTGRTRGEIAQRAPWLLRRFEAGDLDARPGGGETLRELERRARRALAEIAARHRGRRVALVTHQGIVRALASGAEIGHAEWRLLPPLPARG
jgi:broad specificity phosphatase PhoE